MYCPLCGKDIGESKFCPKCVGKKEYMEMEGKLEDYEHNEAEIERAASGSVIPIPKSKSSPDNKIIKKDSIIDFRAVTLTGIVNLFVTLSIYSYTPSYAYVIGALIGGLATGILFKDKLSDKTRGISAFIGAVIAFIIFVILITPFY